MVWVVIAEEGDMPDGGTWVVGLAYTIERAHALAARDIVERDADLSLPRVYEPYEVPDGETRPFIGRAKGVYQDVMYSIEAFELPDLPMIGGAA